jgi:hypothetical protein
MVSESVHPLRNPGKSPFPTGPVGTWSSHMAGSPDPVVALSVMRVHLVASLLLILIRNVVGREKNSESCRASGHRGLPAEASGAPTESNPVKSDSLKCCKLGLSDSLDSTRLVQCDIHFTRLVQSDRFTWFDSYSVTDSLHSTRTVWQMYTGSLCKTNGSASAVSPWVRLDSVCVTAD